MHLFLLKLSTYVHNSCKVESVVKKTKANFVIRFDGISVLIKVSNSIRKCEKSQEKHHSFVKYAVYLFVLDCSIPSYRLGSN